MPQMITQCKNLLHKHRQQMACKLLRRYALGSSAGPLIGGNRVGDNARSTVSHALLRRRGRSVAAGGERGEFMRGRTTGLALVCLATGFVAVAPASAQRMLQVPAGFRAEKVVDGLNFPTGLTWDDQGRMYVAEAGGALYPEQKRPIRIVRVENGRATPITGDLAGSGVNVALVGLTWHNGSFYITHRAAD